MLSGLCGLLSISPRFGVCRLLLSPSPWDNWFFCLGQRWSPFRSIPNFVIFFVLILRQNSASLPVFFFPPLRSPPRTRLESTRELARSSLLLLPFRPFNFWGGLVSLFAWISHRFFFSSPISAFLLHASSWSRFFLALFENNAVFYAFCPFPPSFFPIHGNEKEPFLFFFLPRVFLTSDFRSF